MTSVTLRRVKRAEPVDIADADELTQYGVIDEPIRNTPRWATESAVSLMLGSWDALAVGEVVRRRAGGALDDGTEFARHTTAGTLRQAGFTVTNTPTIGNALHVSVTQEGSWDAEGFHRCFGEPKIAAPPGDALEEET